MTQKNILITGASSGIGEALALHYSQIKGSTLFLCGRNEERLNNVADKCRQSGADVYTALLDVTNTDAVTDWIIKSNQQKPLNLVIANAGVSTVTETEDNIRNTFNTNIMGVINTVLPTIKIYKKDSSSPKTIAIVSSIAGYHGLPACPSYSASKACVKAWGLALRQSLKAENINVSVICPGFVRSRITDKNTCPMPFFMEADKAAEIIATGLEKNVGLIAFPWPLRFTAWLISILPECISSLIYGKLPHKV